MRKFVYKIVFVFIVVFFPLSGQAATLYMEPGEGIYGPGDSFAVDLKIDVQTGEPCINTVEGYISFPSDYLKVLNFITGESILSLWLESPNDAKFNDINLSGKLHFTGGIPGGYCGKIPGDPGDSNLVARIVFRIPSFIVSDEDRDFVDIAFSEGTKVLLNDGLGTEDQVNLKNAKFDLAKSSVVPPEKWREEIRLDNIPPEPFIVELHQDANVYSGRYYIIFNTVDKQTGIDHYEILELRPEEELGEAPEEKFWIRWFGEKREAPNWKTGKMPYLLEDQSLGSRIAVKAMDKAGNERMVEFIPPEKYRSASEKKFPRELAIFLLVMTGGLLVIITIIVFIIKFIHKKRTHAKEDE